MTSDLEYRIIDGECDCCNRKSSTIRVVIMEDGEVVLLCKDCLDFISALVDRHGAKWSEMIK